MVGLLEETVEAAGAAAAPAPSDSTAQPKRVKRVERPDKAALEEEVGKIFEQISTIQTRISEIKALIDGKQQNRQSSSAEVQEAKGRLNELNVSFQAVIEEKRVLRDELESSDVKRGEKRAKAKSLKEKLPFTRVDEIDEEIKKLEYRMSHTSLSLQQEKQLLQQVKELAKSKDGVRDYNDKMENINQDEASRGEIKEKIREKDAILNDLKTQRDNQRSALSEIRERDASQAEHIPGLRVEKDGAFDKIKTLRDEVRELRAAFRAKEDEYWERERQFKEQQQIQRKKEYEKREADRKERDKIRKERELENYVEPYTDEIIMVDQLNSYLQKYIPAAEETASTTPQKAEIVAPKGVGNVLVSKKNKFDEDLDSWFSGKSKGKKTKAPTPSKSNKAKEKLSLSLDALTSFQKMKLTAPTIVGEVSKSVEELKNKKAEFLKLQEEARARRARGEPEVVLSKEEPVEVGHTQTTNEEEAVSERTELETESAAKVDNVEAEKSSDVEAESKEDLNDEQEAVQDSNPSDGHILELPKTLESKLSEGLQDEHPQPVDSKLPEDLEAKLPEDLEA